MRSRQAVAFAAVEAAGLSKTDIGRIAGVHRSQVSRWVSGEQRPSYERTMRLAAHLRRDRPDLADEIISATGYGGDPPPDPLVDPEVAAILRRRYPEDAEEYIAELERRRAERLRTEPGDQAAS
jgi:transcriptional regulator with XRE-family HTH domain